MRGAVRTRPTCELCVYCAEMSAPPTQQGRSLQSPALGYVYHLLLMCALQQWRWFAGCASALNTLFLN